MLELKSPALLAALPHSTGLVSLRWWRYIFMVGAPGSRDVTVVALSSIQPWLPLDNEILEQRVSGFLTQQNRTFYPQLKLRTLSIKQGGNHWELLYF